MKSNPNISKVVCTSITPATQPEYHPIVLKATPEGPGDNDKNIEFKSKDTQDTVMTAEPLATTFSCAVPILMDSPPIDITPFGVYLRDIAPTPEANVDTRRIGTAHGNDILIELTVTATDDGIGTAHFLPDGADTNDHVSQQASEYSRVASSASSRSFRSKPLLEVE